MEVLTTEYWTAKQLEKLTHCKWNRPVNEKHVLEIYRKMMETGYDKTQPILVDKNTLTIPDGSHRAKAAIMYAEKMKDKMPNMKFPVKMVRFANEEEMRKYILDINNTQRVWKQPDYIAVNRETNDAFDICDELAKVAPEYFYTKRGKVIEMDPNTKKPVVKYSALSSVMFGNSQGSKIKNNSFRVTPDDIRTFHQNFAGLEEIIKKIGWTREDVARRRYDMFAQAYVQFMKGTSMTNKDIMTTLRARKLREQLYAMQFTTADGFDVWFGKIEEAFRKRKAAKA